MLLPKAIDNKLRSFLLGKGLPLLPSDGLRSQARRKIILNSNGMNSVDLVFDVGANTGQYGSRMRQLGYKGSIISFEPEKEAYSKLKSIAKHDPLWTTHNYGLGDSNSVRNLNISENSVSSSILDMLPTHLNAAPRSGYVSKQSIEIRRLDDIFEELSGNKNKIWLKLDVQGFEKHVLDGAEASLTKISFIQVELSFVPLYENQETYIPFCQRMLAAGFGLVGIEPGFTNKQTGHMLQADGIFARTKLQK